MAPSDSASPSDTLPPSSTAASHSHHPAATRSDKGKQPLRPSCSLSPRHGAAPTHRDDEAGNMSINEVDAPTPMEDERNDSDDDDNDDDDVASASCLICLGSIQDRTVLPACQHSCFCFECIIRWAELKRRCPLCQRDIGAYVIHSIRRDDDYLRYHLRPPLEHDPLLQGHAERGVAFASSSSSLSGAMQRRAEENRAIRRQLANRIGARRPGGARSSTTQESEDQHLADLALARRKNVYRNGAYALHVGSNRYTRFRAAPTPSQIAASPTIQQRLAAFVRRELYVWPNLDVEFLTTYTVSIMKSLDVQRDEALALLVEFLGPEGAHHFAHEVTAFLRSGREMKEYDACRWLRYPAGERGRGEEVERLRKRRRDGATSRPTTSGESAAPQRREASRYSDQPGLLAEREGDGPSGPRSGFSAPVEPEPEPEPEPGPESEQEAEGEMEAVLRHQVIRRRAKLLARLQEEKKRLHAAVVPGSSQAAPHASSKESSQPEPMDRSSPVVSATQTQHEDEEGKDGLTRRNLVREARLRAILQRTTCNR
ncbi:hypothetical protein ACQY0O_004778 [Thecaphora frezii]